MNEYVVAAGIILLMVGLGVFLTKKLNGINKQQEIPNLWVGLGVLFTFVSFVVSFLFTNWESDNLTQELVPKLGAAFITSIIGISVSKYYSIQQRIQESNNEASSDFESPEMVLTNMRDIMADLKNVVVLNNTNNEKVLNKITDTFNEFAGQVGMSISTNIEEVMKTTMIQMNTTIQSMGETIDNSVKNQFTQQQSNIDQLTKSNNELLAKQRESNLEILEQQKIETKEISQTINSNLESVITSFEGAFKDNVAEITKVFDRLEKWSAASEGKNAIINEKFAELINLQSSKEDVISEEITKQKTELIEMTEIMKKVVLSMENLPTDLDQNNNNFEMINSKLDKLIEKAA